MTKQIKFYTKDAAGNNMPLDTNKIYAEFSSGETLTIEIPTQHKVNDLVLRSYYGDDEFSSPQTGREMDELTDGNCTGRNKCNWYIGGY